MINRIRAISFSPAGSTARVVSRLAAYLGEALAVPVGEDSFTLPAEREHTRAYESGDLVVFGTPVYAGRIPNKALPFVQTLFRGGGARAIAVVTFGNRSFDNALAEMCHELKEHDFRVIGAAAVACRHSFADIGTGRPDEDDFLLLRELAGKTAAWLGAYSDGQAPKLTVPGGEPPWEYYRPTGADGEPTVFLKAKPVVDKAACDLCGTCAKRCPMGSIPFDAPDTTTGICIKCQACVKYCPHGARSFDDPAYLSHRQMLEQTYTRPARTEIFTPCDKTP